MQHRTRHITRHFEDESFQAIDSTRNDSQDKILKIHKKTRLTLTHKKLNPNTNKTWPS